MSQLRSKSPFEFSGGNLCLDFADTVNGRTTEHPEELLTDYARLLQWAEEAGVVHRKTAERLHGLAIDAPGNAQLTLRQALELRDAIFDIFTAVALRHGIPSTALAVLNKATQHASQHAQVSYGNRRFTWEWVLPERNLDSMLWPVARAAADLLVSDDVAFVRQCASDDCAWLFLDKTKNHRRRWCEMRTCGNRSKARRYYQRQRAGTG
jgi:predicted RNA-binding Zn ribbon-like protein